MVFDSVTDVFPDAVSNDVSDSHAIPVSDRIANRFPCAIADTVADRFAVTCANRVANRVADVLTNVVDASTDNSALTDHAVADTFANTTKSL